MIDDPKYFEITNQIPKEDFFVERTKRLKKYFKAILDKGIFDSDVTVTF